MGKSDVQREPMLSRVFVEVEVILLQRIMCFYIYRLSSGRFAEISYIRVVDADSILQFEILYTITLHKTIS